MKMRIALRYISILPFLLILVACKDDDYIDKAYSEIEGIRFTGDISDADRLLTRADKYNITQEFFDCDFHLCVGGSNSEGKDSTDVSTYVIPSGYEGALIPKSGNLSLNWYSRENIHGFWGWTMPIDTLYIPSRKDLTDGIRIPFLNTDLNQTAGTTGVDWKEDAWGNGRYYEQMIGAYFGPTTYIENGIYVPLHFQHIVSKIFLKNLYVIDNYNVTTSSSLKGVITFYGMPGEATLYPCPQDKDGNYTRPVVVMPRTESGGEWDYDQKSRVSYAMTNSSKYYDWEGHTSHTTTSSYKDCWYVCPELDFSRLEYKIEIYEYDKNAEEWTLSPTHGMRGAFYGDFRNVKFKRTGSSGYDNPDGGDETILHAGEYLELTIYLYEKGNPTVQGTFKSWTSRTGTGSSHVEQGIYSYEQLTEMAEVMKSGDPDRIEEYYEMNGSGRDTSEDPEGMYPDYKEKYGQELKILELFDDIGNESYGSTTKLKSLEVADGYILDGQGHTVNVSSSPLTLGPVRDIYIKYHNNSSTSAVIIYIDKMGQVWKVDPYTFVETRTNYNVNDASSNPFTLTFSSGAVS